MELTDRFVRQVKNSDKATGDKSADGGGLYLLMKAAGKYWRMDHTRADNRKNLALGVYPEVSLAKARKRRDEARELLAEGLDPSAAKRAEKKAMRVVEANTFEAMAREFVSGPTGCARTLSRRKLLVACCSTVAVRATYDRQAMGPFRPVR
jgi:hypothetical protein